MPAKPSALSRAAGAIRKALEPRRYGVGGRPLTCPYCGHDRFRAGHGAAILGLVTLACAECTQVSFFTRLPPVLEDAPG